MVTHDRIRLTACYREAPLSSWRRGFSTYAARSAIGGGRARDPACDYARRMRPTSTELAATLGLEPHPEGGFFRETYRAAETVQTPRGERVASTAILFLVTATAISHLHRLAGDELWVYQGGLPLELVVLAPGRELETHVLGDAAESARTPLATADEAGLGSVTIQASVWSPQALVPAGSWQGARLAGGPHLPASRAWALVSCIVSPGFEYEDFELGERALLLAAYPQHAEIVAAFT
jgi:uncharacterized protein